VKSEAMTDEINRLRRCMNDLVSVLALPAMWSGHDTSAVMTTLLEVVVSMLDLDFAYVRLGNADGQPREWVRTADDNRCASVAEIGRLLKLHFANSKVHPHVRVSNPVGDGTVSVSVFHLGFQNQADVLVAASERADFPSESEALLLQVATNQAAIALREAATVEMERARSGAAFREIEERFRIMADSVPEIFWITSLEPEKILYVSPSYERVFGRSLDEHYQNPRLWTDDIHPADRDRVIGEFSRWIAGADEVYRDKEYRIVRPDGEIRWLLDGGVKTRDNSGRVVAVTGICTDITERKRAEEALRKSESYLAAAQRLSRTGSFGVHVSSGKIYWSQEAYRIFECNESVEPTVEALLERTHSEDQRLVKDVMGLAAKEGFNIEYEHRLAMPDGRIKHVRVVGQSNREDSEEIRFVGAITDITKEKKAQDDLEHALSEIKKLKDQLYQENVALKEEIDKASMFEEIVGESSALHAILAGVARVAPTNSTVLILGETGTGKELIARAIHRRSRRSTRPFVSINCAAIPSALIASELFGHEKGAFTGATQRRLGRFELAEGGTIFLDEIGELPADTQISLLRVLQEREFERVGGNRTIATDVRVIAATNKNLQIAVGEGSFRADLYYRLNVFPVEVPPLRERREDVPVLVEYFAQRFAERSGKSIRSIDKTTLQLLQSYDWPGNIRELQNVVERAVIVSDSDRLRIDAQWLSGTQIVPRMPQTLPLRALQTREKETIEAVLMETHGRVAGPFGAAQRLGVPTSTLESKIKALGIVKQRFRTPS
jgi:PAS domain S-box-containing protein